MEIKELDTAIKLVQLLNTETPTDSEAILKHLGKDVTIESFKKLRSRLSRQNIIKMCGKKGFVRYPDINLYAVLVAIKDEQPLEPPETLAAKIIRSALENTVI